MFTTSIADSLASTSCEIWTFSPTTSVTPTDSSHNPCEDRPEGIHVVWGTGCTCYTKCYNWWDQVGPGYDQDGEVRKSGVYECCGIVDGVQLVVAPHPSEESGICVIPVSSLSPTAPGGGGEGGGEGGGAMRRLSEYNEYADYTCFPWTAAPTSPTISPTTKSPTLPPPTISPTTTSPTTTSPTTTSPTTTSPTTTSPTVGCPTSIYTDVMIIFDR